MHFNVDILHIVITIEFNIKFLSAHMRALYFILVQSIMHVAHI